ncbi:Gfo/Idh/MocA family oxidoreductase [Cereibacter sphaeroides]|uniref:Gfo/Idh/MocA family protein n=1 Tax=Cereibacter sphaeroides TaxID=1063 RepID=UPI001F2BDFD0|nr:Gfo/Idh/MocA family oxidoreductase [Cereibacter sphaeroides]MCE6961475.1 Gfo/Idh/MocA family oxidoreductase [Cereibacter sphaeroides]MCE6967344.1 Gfo/Idh/MocA family oxidoreductase [Cereibacter sphaeroides]MCE6971494.1 Gfo/Idh/MocA family oxidoreductase [Cereibacter sphaeroides]
MEPLRWGVMGAGKFAREHMGPAIAAASGARLVALATSDPAKAAPFAALAGPIRLHDSYEALLSDPEVEAVYIPLPNHLHVEWTLRALEAGKHVLTEKPIAMRADEIDRIIALRDRTGLHAAEAFMILHHPQWQRVRELVAGGAIGPVRHVDVAFSYDNRSDPANIRNRAETGGGGLRDIGVYACGCVRFATGAEPVEVEARIQRENGVDIWAQVVGRMQGPEGGFTFSAMTSMRLFPRQEVVLQGDRGLIRVPAPFNAEIFGEVRVELHQPGFIATVERFPTARHYRLQVEAFTRTVRDGAPYACPLEFSRGTQAMLDRILSVAREI